MILRHLAGFLFLLALQNPVDNLDFKGGVASLESPPESTEVKIDLMSSE